MEFFNEKIFKKKNLWDKIRWKMSFSWEISWVFEEKKLFMKIVF